MPGTHRFGINLTEELKTPPALGEDTPESAAFTTLKASTDPVDEHGVGDRGYNDLRYMTKDLNITTSIDPGINEAVSTIIIDEFSGVKITLNSAGNSQTLQDPSDTLVIKRFIVVVEDSTGENTIEVNGITMSDGEAQWFIWNGSSWTAISAVDAEDISFTPVDDIVATNSQSAIAEVNLKSAKNTTIISITGTIAASTNFSTTASGVSYTKSGDNGDLKTSELLFNNTEYIKIMLNGIYASKGVHVTWQSQTSFQLDIIVDSGDEIIILS